MSDDARARLRDGRVWRDFCRALERAGETILRGDAGSLDLLDRAEGFRYLSRLARLGLESFLEFDDPLHPVLFRPAHETIKLGADNPDNFYQKASISGAERYRIRGTRGTVHYLGFGTYYGDYGKPGRRGQSGYLEAKDLAIDPDGRFEIELSCTRPARGNWLPMEPDTASLIVRQTFRDRARERIAELRIERIGDAAPPPPLSPERLDAGLAAAAAFVDGTAQLFTGWAEGFRRRPNELPPFDAATASAAHGDPHIRYFHGYFELAAEQALVVEFVPPRCDYWNFQLNNHWMESLDFRHHRIDLNHHGAVREPDGSVRLVVAQRDPRHPNWLDTAGHARGTMCLRYVRLREGEPVRLHEGEPVRLHEGEPVRAESQSLPRTRVVALDDV